MASSSVSQEDLENDFELSSRRSRIRTARARTVNPPVSRIGPDLGDDGGGDFKCDSLNIGGFANEHDASPKSICRAKEKRGTRSVIVRQPLTEHVNRANHTNKGKQQQRDRRKLREKRRSTGVVHLPSTESTGGSTGEDDDETQNATAETRRNTLQNELLDCNNVEEKLPQKTYPQRRNKSPSDLEADDEDNQEFDSLNQSDSTVSSLIQFAEPPARNNRPGTPTGETSEELLERAQEENRRLLSLLEDKDHKICTLEARVTQLQKEVSQERERLREENAALIRAMASIATAK